MSPMRMEVDDEFWRKAYACLECGEPHTYRQLEPSYTLPRRFTWADPEDGHLYRTVIPIDLLNKLRAHMES